ncbi:MAG TPA: hypothetical protein VGP53_09495 [Acidimicrobiales bacterium]|nr:hypothetical protein [Acidimicrobiales bacterium]
MPAAMWSPEPAPDAAGDNGAVERDGASSSADGGGGAGAPDPGPSPVEASPASAEGTGVDESAGGGERADDLESAALFELDLAKLAERARASALREAVPASEPLPPSAPGPDPTPAPPPDLFPEPVTAPSAAEDEPGQLVAPGPAPLVWGDATQAFDLSRDEEDAETDSTEADTAAGRPQGKAYAPVQAPARTWPAKRPRYPRGQLREPIGILRRIRAMLGIVVVTVLLGVAAGTAVGAFIFFLAFAVRDAITAQ